MCVYIWSNALCSCVMDLCCFGWWGIVYVEENLSAKSEIFYKVAKIGILNFMYSL